MKIAFLGDIAFVGRFDLSQNPLVKDNLREISEFLKGFDCVVANLESPLTNKAHSLTCKAIHLKADPVNVELLKLLHVDIVSLANNHMYDYGVSGCKDTIRSLEKNGIQWFGVDGKSVTFERDNNTLVFNGYCCYSANASRYETPGRKKNFISPLTYADAKANVSAGNDSLQVLSIHWGVENIHYPAPEHIKLARQLAGTDNFILHGHHPHVLQAIERVNQSLIAYSLGNFCFDEVLSKSIKDLYNRMTDSNRKSLVLCVEVDDNKVIGYETIFFKEQEGKLVFTKNNEFQEYCDRLKIPEAQYADFRTNKLKSLYASFNEPRNLKWILKRLNYNFIGAFLKGQRNLRNYKKEFFKK